METAEIRTKPDAFRCPRIYCFNYDPGNSVCNAVGLCTRLKTLGQDAVNRSVQMYGGDANAADWYEPDKRKLDMAGLPWFFFVPSPSLLADDLRSKYISESEDLWGRFHWVVDNKSAESSAGENCQGGLPSDQPSPSKNQ